MDAASQPNFKINVFYRQSDTRNTGSKLSKRMLNIGSHKKKSVHPPAFSWTCIFKMPPKLFCKARERSVERTKNKRSKLPLSQTWGHKNSLATSKKIEEEEEEEEEVLVSVLFLHTGDLFYCWSLSELKLNTHWGAMSRLMHNRLRQITVPLQS